MLAPSWSSQEIFDTSPLGESEVHRFEHLRDGDCRGVGKRGVTEGRGTATRLMAELRYHGASIKHTIGPILLGEPGKGTENKMESMAKISSMLETGVIFESLPRVALR